MRLWKPTYTDKKTGKVKRSRVWRVSFPGVRLKPPKPDEALDHLMDAIATGKETTSQLDSYRPIVECDAWDFGFDYEREHP